MKLNKQITGSVIGAVVSFFTLTSTGEGVENEIDVELDNPYSDVAEDTYYTDAVLAMTEADFIAGVKETRFGTGEELTRADAAVMLRRALGFNAIYSGETESYIDVDEADYYYEDVMIASEEGIIEGDLAGTFRPEDELSRGEMAVILTRAFNLADGYEAEHSFSDAEDHIYEEEIAYVAQAELTTGYPDGTFQPEETVTREEFATFMFREPGIQDNALAVAEEQPIQAEATIGEDYELILEGSVAEQLEADTIDMKVVEEGQTEKEPLIEKEVDVDEEGFFQVESEDSLPEGEHKILISIEGVEEVFQVDLEQVSIDR
ncbi:S-layer homology domain-containing protein [Salsuginibacillus kocurii]|uniref:S-layer homology domain-containing protein n=1 Tax=Salsuginibacillus kocurii TaxID=427078 RepID=UPI00035FE815|nr:S-layer homology domain-containing protein [Salsuginibacillus kocurii]